MMLSQNNNPHVQIVPLSPETLEAAVTLIEKTFPDLISLPTENPRAELEEALWPGSHVKELALIGIRELRYWVAVHDQKVVGVTGLSLRVDDYDEAVWGGWTVYAEEERKGLARARYMLLQTTALALLATGRKYLRIDTDTNPISRAANKFYDRIACVVYKTEDLGPGHYLKLYRQGETKTVVANFLNLVRHGSADAIPPMPDILP